VKFCGLERLSMTQWVRQCLGIAGNADSFLDCGSAVLYQNKTRLRFWAEVWESCHCFYCMWCIYLCAWFQVVLRWRTLTTVPTLRLSRVGSLTVRTCVCRLYAIYASVVTSLPACAACRPVPSSLELSGKLFTRIFIYSFIFSAQGTQFPSAEILN